MIRLFKLTRKTWEESTEWREPITMKPLLGILNRSRRKEMLHCKKNKKVLKWTVHQCPKKEKHHINMISNTYIIAGRQELHLVGWRTVAKKNCVKSEEKKKQKHYFKFCIAVSNLLPLLYCHKSHTNLAFTSTRFLKRCPKSRPRTKKELTEYLLEISVAQLSSNSTLREKFQSSYLIQGILYKWLNHVTPSNYASCDPPAWRNSTILWARNPLMLSNSNSY